jgi:PAP_fibrillin
VFTANQSQSCCATLHCCRVHGTCHFLSRCAALQETLFILNRASLFGTETGEVYQIIDADNAWLQNVITFPPKGAFIVNSSIDAEGDQRMNFRSAGTVLFTSCVCASDEPVSSAEGLQPGAQGSLCVS